MSGGASSERDPVDLLIEQFLEQHRAGEPVTPEAFAEQHPEHRVAKRALVEPLAEQRQPLIILYYIISYYIILYYFILF